MKSYKAYILPSISTAIVIVLGLVLFQNCSSGFQANYSSEILNLDAEFNVLKGQVLTENEIAISGAEISLITSELSKLARTDSRGIFAIPISSEEFRNLPQFFSLIARISNHAPESINFSKTDLDPLSEGQLFPPQTNFMSLLDGQYTKVAPLVSDVIHLGDSSFEGTANSQFQFAEASGISHSVDIEVTAQQLAETQYAQLVLLARGIQNPNTISISSNGVISRSETTPATPETGGPGESRYYIDVSDLSVGTNTVEFLSVFTPANADYDDFEIITAEIVFEKALNSCPVVDSVGLGKITSTNVACEAVCKNDQSLTILKNVDTNVSYVYACPLIGSVPKRISRGQLRSIYTAVAANPDDITVLSTILETGNTPEEVLALLDVLPDEAFAVNESVENLTSFAQIFSRVIYSKDPAQVYVATDAESTAALAEAEGTAGFIIGCLADAKGTMYASEVGGGCECARVEIPNLIDYVCEGGVIQTKQ